MSELSSSERFDSHEIRELAELVLEQLHPGWKGVEVGTEFGMKRNKRDWRKQMAHALKVALEGRHS